MAFFIFATALYVLQGLFTLYTINNNNRLLSIGQQILFLISALGAFNGFILSIYLFIRKDRSLPGLFLGLLLLAISIRVAKSVFLFFNPQLPKIFLQVGLSGCFLIGPALFFYLLSSTRNITRVPTSWKWHWAIIGGIVIVGGIIVPYDDFRWTWNKIVVYIIYGQWLIYMLASGYLLRSDLKTLFVKPSGRRLTEKFPLLVFLSNSIIFTFYMLALLGVSPGIYLYIFGAVAFSFFLYLTIFFYLYSSRIEKSMAVPETTPDRPGKKKIAESDAQLWLGKLERVIAEKTLYKDPNLKLGNLAREINISTHLLSQLLNENLGKSFSTYINEYRIGEACRLIGNNGHLSFEAIGYEVGYNSKSTFYAAFRKIKDTTPALYKENIEKMNHE